MGFFSFHIPISSPLLVGTYYHCASIARAPVCLSSTFPLQAQCVVNRHRTGFVGEIERHFHRLWQNPVIGPILETLPFGHHQENWGDHGTALEKVRREGVKGYLEFLMAIFNQSWTSVALVNDLRSKHPHLMDDEMRDGYQRDVAFLQALIGVMQLEEELWRAFQDRWACFSRRHSIQDVLKLLSS